MNPTTLLKNLGLYLDKFVEETISEGKNPSKEIEGNKTEIFTNFMKTQGFGVIEETTIETLASLSNTLIQDRDGRYLFRSTNSISAFLEKEKKYNLEINNKKFQRLDSLEGGKTHALNEFKSFKSLVEYLLSYFEEKPWKSGKPKEGNIYGLAQHNPLYEEETGKYNESSKDKSSADRISDFKSQLEQEYGISDEDEENELKILLDYLMTRMDLLDSGIEKIKAIAATLGLTSIVNKIETKMKEQKEQKNKSRKNSLSPGEEEKANNLGHHPVMGR